jgi:hypothetical protein
MPDHLAYLIAQGEVRDLGLELLAVGRTDPTDPTWRHAMQQVPVPGRERRTPRRRQLQVTRRRHRRGLRSPIDRRTPSGRLLPY